MHIWYFFGSHEYTHFINIKSVFNCCTDFSERIVCGGKFLNRSKLLVKTYSVSHLIPVPKLHVVSIRSVEFLLFFWAISRFSSLFCKQIRNNSKVRGMIYSPLWLPDKCYRYFHPPQVTTHNLLWYIVIPSLLIVPWVNNFLVHEGTWWYFFF